MTFLDIQNYIERISKIYENSTALFPAETTGTNLVTQIVRNNPAMIQSAELAIMPYIAVFESQNPMRDIEKAGRDSRDKEGGTVYELEIYSVLVYQDITAAEAQKNINSILKAMWEALGNNMRLADPADLTSDPLCRTHTRFQIPYVMVPPKPTIRAMNLVIRPQVYTTQR